ncbi:hypothetical protein QFC19_001039 [Naganishia cerealis]|uniref:Uncharacterized protein n=1 Tax=Naganishia cerealis TaxID=610337 RepID=A0ACC2WK11_9TREE|nr:hypothetical protein QFC19_001039 [Naganishia cerealis]
MSRSYDRALTVFSPDGHLFQVCIPLNNAEGGRRLMQGVLSESCRSTMHWKPFEEEPVLYVGVKGSNAVVLGVEKKSALQLQDPRTVRKVALLDDHICIAFAGLTADGRILIDKARVECQSHRLTVEDPVSVEYITKFVAGVQQKYTQSGGARPFGISTLIVGFDPEDTTPRLYQTEPSGIYSAWKANAIGRSSKTVREFLEKNYTEGLDKDEAIKLTIKSLLEVVQTGAKNIEITYVDGFNQVKVSFDIQVFCAVDVDDQVLCLQNLDNEEVERIVKEIEAEKEAEAERKKNRMAAVAQSAAALSGIGTVLTQGGGGIDSGAANNESGAQ